ncbi:MAG: DUF2306 domain-containing protein [Verrucomicrobiae bacterium]|nr:DUF2306 domain-containing protein [Verrucomicrobiae bacterium]
MIDHLQQHTIGFIHVVSALAALLFGTWIIFTRKGTRRHRFLGRGYFWSMLIVNITALAIYELLQGFGPFHWLALISLVTLIAGYIPLMLKRPNWMRVHAYFMVGSYIGLVAATSAEIATRVPGWSFGTAATVSSVLVNFIGIYLMLLLVPKTLFKYLR